MAKEIKFNVKLLVDGQEKLVTATSSVADLHRVLDQAKTEAEKFDAVLVNFNQHVEKFQSINNAISQIAGTLSTVTEESRTFSAAMNAANTMAGKNGEGFAKLKDEVTELSKTIPVAREELANGLYQVISNGVPEDNWIDYLNKSAKASVGGIADLGETVKVTSTIIKNYGLSWDMAGDVQDKIQLTAKYGVTSFEQLAQALPRVTSNAATLGVSVDELMATFATLTGVSGNTAEVSTQLAAVFTALVKPSSEARKMAQEMGIEFDAAAIKAAGGMRNFLTELDQNVKAYASKSGMLEQEIYGRLFGSAESLRALGPLTGQLAAKFNENVEAMKGSAGTIDDAFAIMSSSGAASLQMLKNEIGEFTDKIASAIGEFLPLLNITSQVGNSAVAVLTLNRALKSFGVIHGVVKARIAATNAASLVWNATSVRMNALTQLMSASFRGAAVSAATLKLAIQGLLIATGVGIAIAAVSAAVGVLIGKCEEGASSVDTMTDAQRKAQEEAKRQSAVQKRLGDSAGELVGKFKTLQAQWNSLKTEGDKTTFIKQNQRAFAELGLHIDDVNSAYKTFVSNAPKVIAALTAIAKAEAWKDIYKDSIKDKATNFSPSFKYAKAKAGDKIATVPATGEMLEEYKAAGVKGDGTGRLTGGILPKIDYGNLTEEDAKRLNDYRYQQGLQRKRNEEQGYDNKTNEALRGLTEALREAEAAKGVLDTSGKSVAITGVPIKDTHTNTIQRNTQEESAPEGSLKYLDKKLSDLKAKIDVEIDPDKRRQLVADYDGVKAEIERTEIECGLRTPEDAEVRTTLEELREQLASKQKEFENATSIEAKVRAVAEAADIQRQIDEGTNGKVTIKAEVEPTYIEQGSAADKRQSYSNAQNKASRIQADYEIGIIGKDDVLKEIEDINRQLAGIGLKPIKIELDSSGFDKAFGDIKSGWGSVQGVGNGIQGISDALENNGDAWQQVSGIINGFISIAEGIQGIVTLFQTLTAATTAHAAASTTDAAATAGETAAATVNTAAKSGEAVANATASGAKMPFPMNLVAIAAGVAAVMAALAAVSGFATGGVIGGTSTSGDKKFARVNSGEMILNKFQQARLFGMISGKFQPPTFTERQLQPVTMQNITNDIEPTTTVVNINMNAVARRIVEVVEETRKVGKKSGRKYNV